MALGGIDLGGTKIQAVVVDDDFGILGDSRTPTPTSGGPADVVAAMIGALREAAGKAGIDPGSLRGVGVGSPGVIDEETGAVSSARNLPGWEGSFAMGEVLERELGVPAAVGNDVNVATDAEFELGAASEFRSLLGVFWGTGVGGGIILDGKAWTGRGAAAEIGHELVDRAVRALGAGVASTVNVLDVEAVVIGGGLGLKLGEPYAGRIRQAMQPHLF